MFDPWGPENSTLREKVIEHLFLAELSKVLLFGLKTPFEVLRSEFDANGYDVVIEAFGVLRHVQLKASRVGGKRANANINMALTNKPSGCVVWIMVDDTKFELGPFYWLGGEPGQPLSAVEGRVGRHSKANASGYKAERQAIRVVPKGRFQRIDTMRALAAVMFGETPVQMTTDLWDEKRYWTNLTPPDRRWADKTHFPIGVASKCSPPLMWIELRKGSLIAHFQFADGSVVEQPEKGRVDFPVDRDGFYDLGGGYLGEHMPKSFSP